MTQRLILASQSPRRRELLAQVGVAFAVEGVAVDERRHSGEAPGAYVERLARAKARAGAGRVASDELVMGADT
ncbi:MAG: septum formation inhibitor Maf, partial [Proteobacteria bacterium SW_6_67_9]